MIKEIKLCDIVNGDEIIGDMPQSWSEVLKDVYDLSLGFPKTVVNIRIATYEPEDDRYKLYFAWEDKEWRSSTVAYIAYDPQKHDFFDWLSEAIGRDERFNHQELVDYFIGKFSK